MKKQGSYNRTFHQGIARTAKTKRRMPKNVSPVNEALHSRNRSLQCCTANGWNRKCRRFSGMKTTKTEFVETRMCPCQTRKLVGSRFMGLLRLTGPKGSGSVDLIIPLAYHTQGIKRPIFRTIICKAEHQVACQLTEETLDGSRVLNA